MSLAAGTRLGPYEILAAIGAGGMGEVYRARDTKLNREVAIKILPDAFADDPERLARFQREAHVLAALNHPHIAAIYGLEETGVVSALVMELVEGPTLADRIALGPMPMDEVLPIAKQIAEALEAAHELGIIHRDLKPANIKVREDGTVKVLDFGLAKLTSPVGQDFSPAGGAGSQDPAHTQSPTITSPAAMTQRGVILGTAAYMAPEQARGKAVDKRADIWAFGCVLFEMLTGQRAFPGDDVSETLASVLKTEPDWATLPTDTSSSIRKLLRRCLLKDHRQRLGDMRDARIEIDDVLAGTMEPQPVAVTSARSAQRERLAWSAAVVVVGVAAFALGRVVYLNRGSLSADTRAVQFSLTPPEGWSLSLGVRPSPGGSNWTIAPLAVSPDGRHVAFVARDREGKDLLWVRSLDALSARALPGTEDASGPFWSPDSHALGFFAQAKLKRIDVAGGPSVTLCDVPVPLGGTWGEAGVIVFAPQSNSGLQQVSASGGTPTAATVLGAGETFHGRPTFLPDGRHFLYTAQPDAAVYVASLESTERARVIDRSDSTNVLYAQGHLLFLRETTLVAQPFDADRRVVTGEAVPVAEQIQNSDGFGQFSASTNGVLAYQTGASGVNSQLVWFDRTGRQTAVLGEPDGYGDVQVSPNGTRAAVSVVDPGRRTRDIWVFDVARGLRTRFTFDPGEDLAPIWSPDGSRIVFSARRKGSRDLYEKASSGAVAEQLVLGDGALKTTSSWSPDGRFIAYTNSTGPPSGIDVWVWPLGGERKPFPAVHTPATESRGMFSPDGRWMAYQSDESGRSEVYVVPFPGPGGKWQVSTVGGSEARWRRDGAELFYLAPDNTLMAATVKSDGSGLEVSAVQSLFQLHPKVGFRSAYDVSADGQRFLANTLPPDTDAPPFTVVLNWTAGLNK